MISYAAFWFVPLLSTLTTPVSAACDSAVTCLCGSSHNTHKLCIDDVRDKDNPCNVWLHCKTCQENQPHCATCPENRTGPTCLEGRTSSCPRLISPGSMSCEQTNNFESCTGSCNPGYSFTESAQEEITLECRRGVWTPLQTFPPCISGGHCELEIKGAGFLNCTTDTDGAHCDVICSGMYQGRYHCFPQRRWTPSLPYCVTPKEGSSSGRPLPPPATPCPCQNEGFCNSRGDCVCRIGWTGTYCNRKVSSNYGRPPSPCHCQNDGFCNLSGDCVCRIGWTGTYCERKISSNYGRPPSPCHCQNDGFCNLSGDCVCRIGWTGTYCERKKSEETPSCPDPGFPRGGDRMAGDGTPASFSRSFSEGESVVFSCSGEDTALQGVSLIRCREDGTWSAARPRCVSDPSVVCPDPGVVNNAVRINTDESLSTPDNVYTPRQSVVYNCRGGYRLRGNSMRTCMSTGQWSGSAPSCSRIGNVLEGPDEKGCRHPEADINGFIEDDPPRRARYPPRTQLAFGCRAGYRPVGAVMLYCLSTGAWTSLPPTCEETSSSETDSKNQQVRNCPNFGPIAGGSFSVFRNPEGSRRLDIIEEEDGEPEDDDSDFLPGTSLRYTCNDKLIIIGSDILTCLPTGDWNTDPPFCIEDCGRSLMKTSHKLTNASRTQPGEWPWMVAVAVTEKNRTGIVCGGALIDNQTVLTAAHCVDKYPFFTLYFGKFHRYDIYDDGEVEKRRTTRILIHEGYDNGTYNNDIALLRFEPSVVYSERIQPICLPTPNSTAKDIIPEKMGYVTGWGKNEKKLLSDKLMVAQLPVQRNEECVEAYEEIGLIVDIHPGTFCAGYPEGVVSTCVGDSGSPLVFFDGRTLRHTIEGVVSYGQNRRSCDYERAYTVFTKVGHYMLWILGNWPCHSEGRRRSGLKLCSPITDEP